MEVQPVEEKTKTLSTIEEAIAHFKQTTWAVIGATSSCGVVVEELDEKEDVSEPLEPDEENVVMFGLYAPILVYNGVVDSSISSLFRAKVGTNLCKKPKTCSQ